MGKAFLSYQLHKVKGYRHTDIETDRPTDRHVQSNMPSFFKGGHKYISNKYCLNQHYDLIQSDKNKEGKIVWIRQELLKCILQSSIISPSREETFLKTFGNITSNEINTINGEDKICWTFFDYALIDFDEKCHESSV